MEHRGQLWVSGIENMFAGRPKIAFSTWTGTPYQERVGGGP